MKSYSTMERNGFVFLWHHAEDIDPVWEPPEIDEIASGQWKYCGRSEHFVNAHIEVRRRTVAGWVFVVSFNVSPLQFQPTIGNDTTYGG